MRILLIPSLVLLVACGDDGGGDTAAAAAPTFTELKEQVLTPTCGTAGCHDPATAENGLVFDASTSAAMLVDVESIDAPGQILVVAGDPDNSYLVKKIEGASDIVGDQMPPPFGFSDEVKAEYTQMIRDWVADGAQDN